MQGDSFAFSAASHKLLLLFIFHGENLMLFNKYWMECDWKWKTQTFDITNSGAHFKSLQTSDAMWQ